MADSKAEGPQGAAASLLNGLRVLEAFGMATPSLGVTEVAHRVGLHKSTVSRILSGLAQTGYVERDDATGKYRLGLGIITLAGPLLAELDVRRLTIDKLEHLTETTRETSALSVWNGSEAVAVEQVPSPQAVKHTAYVGTRYNRWESSSVRVFLAHLPLQEVGELLASRRIRANPTPPADLEAALALVRNQGYDVNDGRTDPQEFGISAAVYDYAGAVAGCVTLSVPRSRVTKEDVEQLVEAVRRAAQRITQDFGAGGAGIRGRHVRRVQMQNVEG